MTLGDDAIHGGGRRPPTSPRRVGWNWMEVSASRGMLSPFRAKNSSMVVTGM